ncbi:hypothetical protein IPZ58_32760 [Streptomyces roseoverticillatus]|uniref:hypothetical protein n=1 Tax=Streptomyces roseoverticillatus TaxID=66429 RepID=UPI001F387E56|nr:hypothetical protein [Streptomyces roseoverticillatus]MCF3106306.1 hypothetical protein [Streptomyces roseoverticillatus]
MACAATPAAADGPASPQPAKRMVLTNADDGQSVTVDVGDDTEVRLTAYRERGLTYTWAIPQSSDSAVLRRTSRGTTPAGGSTATFHVQRSGTATITAHRHCHPDRDRVCPLVVAPWKATVSAK